MTDSENIVRESAVEMLKNSEGDFILFVADENGRPNMTAIINSLSFTAISNAILQACVIKTLMEAQSVGSH